MRINRNCLHLSLGPAIAGLCSLLFASCGGSGDVGTAPTPTITPTTIAPTLGLTWPVATYEAENGQLSGTATVVGAPDESDRTVGDLGGEASHRQAVVLSATSDSVSWTVAPTENGANALVVRFSIPDAPAGGGAVGMLNVSIQDSSGNVRAQKTLGLTSRYAWLYGGVMDGTKLFDVPANAAMYGTAHTPTHLYDEIQLLLNLALHSGDVITFAKTPTSGVSTIAVDFIELETLPAALPQPSGFLSLTDPRCGAIALDVRQTNAVFDGADDSSYGSVFNTVLGNNPFNPVSFAVIEKDYYSTDPTNDSLQDTTANASAAGLSMFQLADHNFQSLQTCINLVVAAGSGFSGVYVPSGRFYIRGLLLLPSAITIQGAGMWYSKFTAVDTAPPTAASAQGRTGIASVSGNFVISSQQGGADKVTLANFAIFGNVTQRDVVDSVIPDGIRATLTNSRIDNIWVEHTFSGIKTNGSSSAVQITNSRVRNTFADGIDFYGSTSNSSIKNSTSRSTGDDGFAMWSQGSTLATTSQSNGIANSTAQLQWYGNGFAVYGGMSGSITQSVAADILNYPCLQMSTQFVAAALPTSVSMSAAASNLDFYRCGGNGFNQQFGALLLGTDLENVDGLTIDSISIASPTFKAIDIRPIPSPTSHTVVATLNNVSLQNVEIVGAPICAAVAAYTGGAAQFSNVCSCASTASVPVVCGLNNASASTFQIAPNTCSATQCPAF